jgi:hypothetical protein
MPSTMTVRFIGPLCIVITERTGAGHENISGGRGCGGEESGSDGSIARLGGEWVTAGMLCRQRSGGQGSVLSSSLLAFVES